MEVYCAIVTSILGISFPLLLQAIERIDTKYNSKSIVSLFCSSLWFNGFVAVLAMNIVTLIFLGFRYKYGEELSCIADFVDKYIELPLLSLLIVAFFILCYNVTIYYQTEKLIKRLVAYDKILWKLYNGLI